ncbi:unnamed protein product, partial [Allacma fusca]
VLDHFVKEMTSLKGEYFEEMLNKGYRILIYAAQFNLYTPHEGINEVVTKLKWNGADKFSKAPRKIWRVNNDVAGFVKMADNFTFASVRNAGNYAIIDQPDWVLDLVEKFLENHFSEESWFRKPKTKQILPVNGSDIYLISQP